MSRLEFPATRRNRDPLLAVLREVLPPSGDVLEIASGSGEHICHFASAFPDRRWFPTDLDPTHLQSVDAWVVYLGLTNVAPAQLLDVTSADWPPGPFGAVISANMVHIAPWEATVGLFAGAARVLAPGGLLLTYGPYRRGGAHTAPSNAEFDSSLRSRDPRWGVRDIEAMAEVAPAFQLEEVRPMPANNFTLRWRRRG